MALFTSTSSLPQRSYTVSTAGTRVSSSSKSKRTPKLCCPQARMASSVSLKLPGSTAPVSGAMADGSPGFMVRAVTATSKPRSARATAVALPMPRLAPVTSATLFRDASLFPDTSLTDAPFAETIYSPPIAAE